MDKKKLGYSYKFTLETVSPLHIGNGNFVSSKSHLLDDEAKIIDQRQVTKASPLEINEHVNSNSKLFVPGSSLKGAFRTAILYYWLKNNNEGKKSLKKWLEDINTIIDDRTVPFYKKPNKIHKQFYWTIEKECFGDYKMGSLKITDSNLIEDDKSLIYELKRYWLTSDYTGIPTFNECIIPNTETVFRLSANYSFKITDSEDKIYNSIVEEHFSTNENIIKLVNNHSLALVDFELSIFENENIVNDDLNNYLDMLKVLQKKIISDNQTAYIRLGAGKMQFHQTVALALLNFEADDKKGRTWFDNRWENYIRYVQNFKEREIELPYPKTRALTIKEQLPLGWVKVKFI